VIDGAVARIRLSQGYEAIVDLADLHLVAPFTWTVMHSARTSYARRTVKGKTILLHRVVFGGDQAVRVDHRDGDGLNCRRSNLRAATYAQNNRNTRLRSDNKSGFKGVRKHSQCNKFQASICTDGIREYLGLFTTAEEAYAAYCAASAEQHQQFGRTA
jgi:hypothetical protein